MNEPKQHNLESQKGTLDNVESRDNDAPKQETELSHAEVSEFVDNLEISENVSEKKDKASSGSGKNAKQTLTHEEKVQLLINSKPKEGKMQKDLTRHFTKELNKLKKENKRYKNNVAKAFEFSDSWKKIKEIYQTLSSVAGLTYDALKKLWLKVIHGIVI